MIKIEKLIKSYFTNGVETQVLKGVNVYIPTGQFVAIIGPSGAGKSTLLYQMSLLDKPTSGTVTVDDTLVSDFNEAEATAFRLRNFGFVFQDYSLVPELTALENIITPILMKGVPEKEAVRRAREIMATLEVERLAHKTPSQMSGGEQQRVSIGRAIADKPKILFADEPTASLDTVRSEEVIEALLKLNREQAQTIVMVTHELEYAQRADRIIELKDGIIVGDHMRK